MQKCFHWFFHIPQWIKVDLGEAYHIDEILVNFEASYAQEFTISGSLDDSDYFVIREVNDGTKDENHYTDLGGKEARYIKLDLKSRPYTEDHRLVLPTPPSTA